MTKGLDKENKTCRLKRKKVRPLSAMIISAVSLSFLCIIMGLLTIIVIFFIWQHKDHIKKFLLKLDHFQVSQQDVLKNFQDERKRFQELLDAFDQHMIAKSQAEIDILTQIFEKLGDPRAETDVVPNISSINLFKTGAATLETQREVEVDFSPYPEDVLAQLRQALKSDQVDLLLQPIVSLPQRKTRFFECYSRIKAGEGKAILSPETYISIAEKAGLMPTIDNAILFRSIQIIRKVQKKQVAMGFFVNISEYSISDRFFMESLIEFIDSERQILKGLYFELTNEAYQFLRAQQNKLHAKLVQRGARFSLDQSEALNLNVKELQDQGFSYVKVDQHLLIKEINAQGLDAVIAFKESLDKAHIDLIATKLEKEEDLKQILDLGVDYGQGFLFGRPTLYR